MADQLGELPKEFRFDELPKGANQNKLLSENQVVKLTPDNYKQGIQIKAGKGINEEFGNIIGRDKIEIVNQESKTLGEDVRINIDITPTVEGGYKVKNPHPQQEMSIWIYGEEIIIKPGDTVDVPANKPDKYKDLEGVESGTFYISAGTDQAIKVSRKPLSNEVSIKNFSIDKKASGHQDYVKNQPSIDLHNSSVDWEASKIQHNDQGDSIFPIIVDSDKSELGGQIRVDQSGRVILTPTEKYFSAWVKDNRYPQGMNMSGDIVLTSETYFRIGDKVFIYEGLKKDGTPRIVEVKK